MRSLCVFFFNDTATTEIHPLCPQGALPILERLLPKTSLPDQQRAHLQSSFGIEAAALVASWSESDREPLSDVIPVCRGELRHAISAEHACTATDVLARRCRLAMVDQDEAERLLPQVQALLQEAGVGDPKTPEGAGLNLSS